MKIFLQFAMLTCLLVTPLASSHAQDLEIPIMEIADEDLDTCALGEVRGLKADGDGFLAVRTGPGTNYSKIDELNNKDKVWLYEQRGKWIGIAYATDEAPCDPIDQDRPLQVNGKKGWVHENWISIIAG